MSTINLQSIHADLEYDNDYYSFISFKANPEHEDDTELNINTILSNLQFNSFNEMQSIVRTALNKFCSNEFMCIGCDFSLVYTDANGETVISDIM